MSIHQGRYQILGFEANADYDDLNRNVDSHQQIENRELTVVYATDDLDEARAIMRAGGFLRNDKWVVARQGRTL